MANKNNMDDIRNEDKLEEHFYPEVEVTICEGVEVSVQPKQVQRKPTATPKLKMKTGNDIEGRVIGSGQNRVVVKKHRTSPLHMALAKMPNEVRVRMYQLDPTVFPEARNARGAHLNRVKRRKEMQSIVTELQALRERHEYLKNENQLLNIQIMQKKSAKVTGSEYFVTFDI